MFLLSIFPLTIFVLIFLFPIEVHKFNAFAFFIIPLFFLLKKEIKIPKLSFLFLLFLSLYFSLSLLNRFTYFSLLSLAYLSLLLSFYFFSFQLEREQIPKFTVLSSIPSIFYGFYQKILLSSGSLISRIELEKFTTLSQVRIIERLKEGRIFSLFPLPTSFCFFLSIISLLSIGLGSAEKKFKLKIFYYSMTVLSLILMIFTKSFGGILGFLAGFFLLLFLIGKRDLRILLIILTISVSIFSTIVYLRIETLETKNPLTLRLLNWNLAMRVISQHPFFGVGPGNYPSFSLQLAKERTEATKYAHSFFLQLTAETGIFCAILLFIVIFEWFRKRVKLISIDYCEAGVWSAILSLLIYNLIDIGIYFESFGILTVILISYLSNRNDYFEIRRLGKYIFSSALTIMIIFSCWVYITEELIQKVSFEMEGDFSLAEKHLIFTRKINPFNPKIYSYLSFIESKKDDLESALEYIEKSISLYPYSHSLYYERGVIYLKLGEPIKAYLSIREAEKFNPTYSPYMEERKKHEDFLFRRRK